MTSPVLENLELEAPQLRYRQVAEQLRRQIESGALKPGERVPSFPEMRARYGVSQATMEKAHAILEQEGLTVRRRGLGTFVVEPKTNQPLDVIGIATGAGLR